MHLRQRRPPQDDRAIEAEMTVSAGERAVIAMTAGDNEPLGVPSIEDVDARIDLSDEAWRTWAQNLRYPGRYREAVLRSALALKLLLFSPSGAIAAATTTSLPERVGGSKNFDYRYAWVRDAAYAVNAFIRLGILPESKAAFTWLIHRLSRLHGGTRRRPPLRALGPRRLVSTSIISPRMPVPVRRP